MKRSPCFLLLFLATLLPLYICFPIPALAADKSSGIPKLNALKSDSPLRIASDRMEVSQKDKTIVFQGHVVVQQDDLTMTGTELKVYALANKKSSEPNMVDQVDRIELEGNVRITQRDKAASAEKAVYYHQEQKIVLMGNPSVSQGQDRVQGRLITLYIADGRSVIEGGEATPVQAVLHPRKE